MKSIKGQTRCATCGHDIVLKGYQFSLFEGVPYLYCEYCNGWEQTNFDDKKEVVKYINSLPNHSQKRKNKLIQKPTNVIKWFNVNHYLK